jgi:hypothetical protein
MIDLLAQRAARQQGGWQRVRICNDACRCQDGWVPAQRDQQLFVDQQSAL